MNEWNGMEWNDDKGSRRFCSSAIANVLLFDSNSTDIR